MITIYSSADVSEPTLIGLEATLTTPDGEYAMSSNGPMADSGSSLAGGLFGAIAWPQSRYRLAPGLLLEQQMFLPHDRSAVAFSWQLRGDASIPVRLAVTPLFAGCGPQSYRDNGFRFQSQEEGGRLTWLPNVLGPTIIADTNGRYLDNPPRSVSSETLVPPGTFEFELNHRPSVLIFSNDRVATQRNCHIGTFLAGLMRDSARPAPTVDLAATLIAA